jgi:Protein kinase domain
MSTIRGAFAARKKEKPSSESSKEKLGKEKAEKTREKAEKRRRKEQSRQRKDFERELRRTQRTRRERQKEFSPTMSADSITVTPSAYVGGGGGGVPAATGGGGKEKRHKDKDRLREMSMPLRISSPRNFVRGLHIDQELHWMGEGDADAADMFELVEKLGEGAFGSVYRGVHRKSGMEVAIKSVLLGEGACAEIENEMDILKKCRHPNVVPYYGCVPRADRIWILMDLCSMGSLQDIMRVLPDGALSETQIAAVLMPVLNGLAYLHSQGIMHRDIKAGNILMNEKGDPQIGLFDLFTCALILLHSLTLTHAYFHSHTLTCTLPTLTHTLTLSHLLTLTLTLALSNTLFQQQQQQSETTLLCSLCIIFSSSSVFVSEPHGHLCW